MSAHSLPPQAIAAFATNEDLQKLRISPDDSIRSKWTERSTFENQASLW